MKQKHSNLRNGLLLLLLACLGVSAVVLGLACSANPTGPTFTAPLQTVQAGNPTLTFTPTFTFSPTATVTGTPTVTNTPNPYVTVSWTSAFGSSSFNHPSALAVQNFPAIYLYVADTGNNRVEKFTNTGSLVTSWGAGGKGKGIINFNSPLALAVTASSAGTTLFVAGPSGIGVYDGNGNYLTAFTNNGTGSFSNPKGLALDGTGNLFVSDSGNRQIVRLSPQGNPLAYGTYTSGSPLAFPAGTTPAGIAVDGANNLYVALDVQGTHPGAGTYDSVNVYTSNASFTWTYTGFYQPNGLALDTAGNLYVADTGNKTVELWSPLGSFTNSPSVSFNANNSLVTPVAVAVDSTNEVYVADSGNNTLYNFAP